MRRRQDRAHDERLALDSCPHTWLSEPERAVLPTFEQWQLVLARRHEAAERSGYQPSAHRGAGTESQRQASAAGRSWLHEPCASQYDEFVQASRRALFSEPCL